jgi:GTP cyclohydrolase II
MRIAETPASPSTAPEATDVVASIRARVPLPMGDLRGPVHGAEVASFDGLPDQQEHLAVLFAGWSSVPLVRLHSECLTGDVFESQRCDCGPQLREAVTLMRSVGGIILYLRQEGRGIGLYNKLDAYRLQDAGLDTYAANRELNFADDSRDYTSAAHMLRALGVPEVRLLTNNPDKAEQMRSHGIAVREVLSTSVFVTEANRRYLASKRDFSGHRIENLETAL